MTKSHIPRGVRLLACGCYFIRYKGKLQAVVTCKEHRVSILKVPIRARRRKKPLD